MARVPTLSRLAIASARLPPARCLEEPGAHAEVFRARRARLNTSSTRFRIYVASGWSPAVQIS